VELLKRCHLEIELRDSREHVKCLRKISRIQHRESAASEKSESSYVHLSSLVVLFAVILHQNVCQCCQYCSAFHPFNSRPVFIFSRCKTFFFHRGFLFFLKQFLWFFVFHRPLHRKKCASLVSSSRKWCSLFYV